MKKVLTKKKKKLHEKKPFILNSLNFKYKDNHNFNQSKSNKNSIDVLSNRKKVLKTSYSISLNKYDYEKNSAINLSPKKEILSKNNFHNQKLKKILDGYSNSFFKKELNHL